MNALLNTIRMPRGLDVHITSQTLRQLLHLHGEVMLLLLLLVVVVVVVLVVVLVVMCECPA